MKREDSAEILKRELQNAERPGVGRSYPLALRRAAVSHLSARQASGVSVGAVAQELGLAGLTLRRWARRDAPGDGFASVRVVNDEDATGWVVFHAPHGLRIECDVATAAELLRRLG